MMKKLLFACAALLLFGLLSIQTSCKNENEEDLFDKNSDCDTLAVQFSTTISEIFTANGCDGCHANGAVLGGVNLDNFTATKVYVDNGKLLCSVKHGSSCSNMPQGGGKIALCDIQKIEVWINDGAPDN